MRKVLALAMLLLSLFALSHPASAAPAKITVAGDCQEPLEAELVHLINNYRVDNGLNRLYSEDTLSASAEHFSQDMSHHGWDNDHYLSTGESWADNQVDHGYSFNTYRGQNIAAREPDPQTILAAWIASPGHNANMLNPHYTAIGVGYAYNPNDPGDPAFYRYWTADFGGYHDAQVDLC